MRPTWSYDEMMEHFRKLDEKSRSVTARIWLAEMLLMLNDRAQARVQLRKAREKLQEVLKLLEEVDEALGVSAS